MTPVISKHLSEEAYYDPITDEVKTIPRVGAFEIMIFDRTVFSKLKTGVWPHIPTVITLIKQLIQGYERGEDFDQILEQNNKMLVKTTSGAHPTSAKNLRKMKERPTSVSRAARLDPIHSNAESKQLSKTNSQNNSFTKLRSKTPEPERTKSPFRRTSNVPFLPERTQKSKPSAKEVKQTLSVSIKPTHDQNRSFRIHRFSAAKSGKKALGNDDSVDNLSVHGQDSVLNSTVLESNLNGTFTNTPQSKLLLDFGGGTQDYQIKQLRSTRDTEDQLFQNQISSQNDDIRFSQVNSMEADDLIKKYDGTQDIDADFPPRMQQPKHNLEFSQLKQKLKLFPLSRDNTQDEGGRLAEYPDSFRANQTTQTQNQVFQQPFQPFHLEQATTIYETPKYGGAKEFFGPTELQKTAQFVRNTQFSSQNQEAPENKRPPSRGLNRYIKRLEITELPIQTSKVHSSNVTVGEFLQSEDNQLTFRNTGDKQVIMQETEKENEYMIEKISKSDAKVSAKSYFQDLNTEARESSENKFENSLLKEQNGNETKPLFRRKKYHTPDRKLKVPSIRSHNKQ